MMLRLWLVIGCSAMLWAFGSIAPAQTAGPVTVRSGDHAGFSRLVLDMPRRVEWDLREAGRDRIVSLAGSGWRFKTGTVFQRMGKGRITAVEAAEDGDGLRLNLDCTCIVEVFWHGTAMLVVDVRDPPAVADDTARPVPARVPFVPARDGQAAAPSLTAETLAPLLPMQGPSREAGDGSDRLPSAKDTVVAVVDHGQAREQLARHLAQAASMGLLNLRPGKLASQAAPAKHPVPTPGNSRAAPPADAPPVRPGGQIRAQTSIGRGVLGYSATQAFRQDLTQGGAPCLGEDVLDVAAWGEARSFAAQIGPARARLTAEFDRFSQDAALGLARLYLHFGFGAEAGQVLKAAQASGEAAQVVRAMADVMEDGHARGSVLAGQMSCPSGAALWSALSYSELPGDMAIDEDAILRGLNELPAHLREYLAPQLARKFTAARRPRMAARLLRVLERGGNAPLPAEMLAGAEVDLAEGRAAPADRRLGDVVAANDQSSAAALLRRINERLRNGGAIPHDMADLAGAYAQEYRNTPVGHALARAYIGASAATGAFDRAFADLARLAADLPEPDRQRVMDTVMEILADSADDVTFLRHALDTAGIPGHEKTALAARAAHPVAARLIALGFPQSAEIYLARDVAGPQQRARRLLRARAALSLRRPRQAQVDLLGLIGADANRLRAAAQTMIGEYRAAHLLHVAGGQTDAARRAALLAEDWDRAAALGDREVAQLTALASPSPDGSAAGAVLARDRELLNTSAAVRTAVTSLLSAHPSPEDGPE